MGVGTFFFVIQYDPSTCSSNPNGYQKSITDGRKITVASPLTLTKTPNPTTYSAAGQTITYTYTIKNTGDVPVTGPFTINDNKTTVSCPAGDLAAGASMTCTATYMTTGQDVTAGSVTNTATATSGKGLTSNTVTATVKDVSISLTKTANPITYSTVGQTITYTYTYTIKNTGTVTLPGPFSISDNIVKTGITCASGPLAPGATLNCSGTYSITQADLNAGSVTNIATASTTFNGNTVTSNQATATVTSTAAPAISLVKTANPTTYSAVGQVITYTYTITNSGNVQLPGPFTVTDNKIATVTCAAGPLNPGASLTCSGTYTITQADLNSGSVTNVATAHTTYNNTPVNSNTVTVTVTGTQTKTISLTKTPNPTTYNAVGQVITYTYVIKNIGNVSLAGPFTVSDNKIASVTCPTGGLAPGASENCSGTYTITAADITAGSVNNTATASGNGVLSNQATATVTATTPPPITLGCEANLTATVGVPFNSGPAVVTGGVPPYTFSIVGTLPPGLTLNPSTGAVTGTPTAPGSFSVEVTDAVGNVAGGGASPLNLNAGASYIFVDIGNSHLGWNAYQLDGNVLFGQGLTVQLSGGNNGGLGAGYAVYADPTTNISGSLQNPITIVSIPTSQTAAAAATAQSVSNYANGLTPTQTFGNINNTLTINGNGGLNVISVANIQNATLTIHGTANDYFVFNVSGQINTNHVMSVSGGVPASHILWNLTGTGTVLQTSGGNSLIGTFLATNGGAFQFSELQLRGELINTGGNIQLVSGNHTLTQAGFTPPPLPGQCLITVTVQH
jgi:uncharacterized repeat protein (TIGR01451 family)